MDMPRSGIVAGAIVAVVLPIAAWSLRAHTPVAAAAPAVPVVVELFTSEGCSSCPPADALLSDLVASQPVPGALVIALSEHVDYWNSLGWRDPFSSETFSDRQRTYGEALGVSDIYTPEAVIDGATECLGSDRTALIRAIAKAAARPKQAVSLTWQPESGAVTIAMAPNAASARARVSLAVTEDGLSSDVNRGENSGHRLSHTAVVRRFVHVGDAAADGHFDNTAKVQIDRAWQVAHLHVVAFAQDRDGRTVAAGAIGPVH